MTQEKIFHGDVWAKEVGEEEGDNIHIETLASVKTLRIDSDWNVWVTKGQCGWSKVRNRKKQDQGSNEGEDYTGLVGHYYKLDFVSEESESLMNFDQRNAWLPYLSKDTISFLDQYGRKGSCLPSPPHQKVDNCNIFTIIVIIIIIIYKTKNFTTPDTMQ